MLPIVFGEDWRYILLLDEVLAVVNVSAYVPLVVLPGVAPYPPIFI